MIPALLTNKQLEESLEMLSEETVGIFKDRAKEEILGHIAALTAQIKELEKKDITSIIRTCNLNSSCGECPFLYEGDICYLESLEGICPCEWHKEELLKRMNLST